MLGLAEWESEIAHTCSVFGEPFSPLRYISSAPAGVKDGSVLGSWVTFSLQFINTLPTGTVERARRVWAGRRSRAVDSGPPEKGNIEVLENQTCLLEQYPTEV